MKPNKQLTILPRVHKNVKALISQIRSILKEKHNFSSISSKNADSPNKITILNNHCSLGNIKMVSKEQTLIERYKKMRSIEAPYRQIVDHQPQQPNKRSKEHSPNRQSSYFIAKYEPQGYFRKKSKLRKSLERNKKEQLMELIFRKPKQKKHHKSLRNCLELSSKISQSNNVKRNQSIDAVQNISEKANRKRILNQKYFQRQHNKTRGQSFKGFPYEPWQSKTQQNDLSLLG